MNNLTNKILFCLLLCLASFQLSAQAVIKLGNYTLAPGEELDLPIQVTGFTNILGMQFQLEWDSTVLEFIGHSDYNLLGLGPLNFGPANPTSSLKVSWFTFVSNGETLADDETVFVVKFKVIGEHQDSTALSFSTDFPVELIDINQPLAVTTISGSVVVDDPNDLVYPVYSDAFVKPAFPNPFRLSTVIPFYLSETSLINLRIYDMQGRVVHIVETTLPEGNQEITIDEADLPGPGIFNYHLYTNHYRHAGSFVYNQ